MTRQDPIAKLREHFKRQSPPGSESVGSSEQHGQQTVSGSATQTQGGDLSLFAELLTNLVERFEKSEQRLDRIEKFEQRLDRIERTQTEFVNVFKYATDEDRPYYTPREFAERLMREGVKEFKGEVEGGTRRVQQWCRDKRLKAQRRPSGRGEHGEWMIPHDEYVRYKNHGLLPLPKN